MRAPSFKLGATPFSSWTNIDKTVANPITGPKTQITAGQLGFFHYFFVTKLGNSSAKWKTFAPVLIIFNFPEVLSKYIHIFFLLILRILPVVFGISTVLSHQIMFQNMLPLQFLNTQMHLEQLLECFLSVGHCLALPVISTHLLFFPLFPFFSLTACEIVHRACAQICQISSI